MNCFSCGHENPAQAKFCLECGGRLVLRCSACNAELPTGAKFCLECGKSISAGPVGPPPEARSYTHPKHLAERIPAEQAAMEARGAAEGERETITALFADIKGSMEPVGGLHSEEARSIIDPVLQLMMDSVRRYEGYVAQSTGDGIFALFGALIAHEDHSQRALHAALHMQEEACRYAYHLQSRRM